MLVTQNDASEVLGAYSNLPYSLTHHTVTLYLTITSAAGY